VKATIPSSAPQNITLDVQISGSGFEAGSIAQWLLNGAEDARVRTNSTQFVNSSSLVANITIAQDAVPTLYDVAVITPQGKKGIGTEKFTVLAMEQLASPPGGGSYAWDVTTTGVVAGSAAGGCDGYNVPVLWVNGVVKNLPMPAGLCRGRAFRINESGEVIGYLYPAGATSLVQTIPVLWKPVGAEFSVQELGVTGSGRPYDVMDFNESSHAVVNLTVRQAYWWSETTGFVRLPEPTGSTGCYADGLNDLDEIVGSCEMSNIVVGKTISTTAFWSSPSSIPVLLPRLTGYNYYHFARDLNNNGVAVGQAWNNRQSGLVQTGVRYVRNGTTWTIEVLPDLGGGGTYPVDINDDGWVTGYSGVSTGGKRHAMLWRAGQVMKDLGAIGPESWASAITPTGAVEMLVVGYSTFGSEYRAVLWRPQQ
jgi:probable HAF family extracellular repeat protein